MQKAVVLVGEAKGDNEERINAGFVGASGIELLRMLNEAKLIELTDADYDYIRRYYDYGDPTMIDCIWQMHPEVYRTNVFQKHPPGNKIEAFCGGKASALPGYPVLQKSKYVLAELKHEIERLADELVSVDPNLVVALGNTALWALCGRTGISKLRGTTCYSTHAASGYKVLPTYHPAAVIRQWELRPVTVIDLAKAKREAEYPDIRRPKRDIWIAPTIEDLYEFKRLYISDFLSVDIENPGGPIQEIGFAPNPALALVVPILKGGKPYWSVQDFPRALRFCKDLLEERVIKKVFQNGLYDLAVILRQWGFKVRGFDEDTMLAHHALQPESLKSLGFLGSVYTDEGSWKQMRKAATTLKRDD